MKSVILGTAGHIDHGKTTLVRALTGIDTDRLEEEKRRGITIELGFAHLELALPSGDLLRCGFIDVPGHERFVRNMLAGVGGMDLVLLVVAADESIKPQTREHFEICRLLSIPRGIVVITKADLVDAETLHVVRLEIEEFVRGSFLDLSRAPVVEVSARAGTGLEQLKGEIVHLAVDMPSRDSEAFFRLPIDRVFAMKGFGPVVTGTLIAGKVHKEEEVELFPSGRRVRVRGVQVHGSGAQEASAGQRTALNLAGVEIEDLARGMTLTVPGALQATQQIDVQLSLLRSAKPLKNRARVHLHAFTSETIAEVMLHEAGELRPGETALARLRTSDPVFLLPGDRAILRQFSPVVTIGGVVALDTFPQRRTRQKSGAAKARGTSDQTSAHRTARAGQESLLAFLRVLVNGSRPELLLARIARRAADGLSLADLVRETGLQLTALQPVISELLREKRIVQAGARLVSAEAFAGARTTALAALAAFHQENPLVRGVGKEELRTKLGFSPDTMEALLANLLAEKKVEASGEQVRLAGRGVELKQEETAAKDAIEKAFLSAGLKAPAMKEVLAKLSVDKSRAEKLVTLLLRDRVLVKLADDLVFHQNALHSLRQIVLEYKTKSPRIDVPKFKDLTGISRKYAIPLLEYLDRERVTRRMGDERIIL